MPHAAACVKSPAAIQAWIRDDLVDQSAETRSWSPESPFSQPPDAKATTVELMPVREPESHRRREVVTSRRLRRRSVRRSRAHGGQPYLWILGLAAVVVCGIAVLARVPAG